MPMGGKGHKESNSVDNHTSIDYIGHVIPLPLLSAIHTSTRNSPSSIPPLRPNKK